MPALPVYALSIHTTSPELGLAISNFAGDDRSQIWNLGRETSNHLHECLLEFLPPQSWADLAFIAVANGPGGFTGTRIGVVAARTLAQQLEIPLFGISTLAAIAQHHYQQCGLAENPNIAVQLPAQRGELFGAIYGIDEAGTLIAYSSDNLFTPDDWQTLLARWPQPYELVLTGNNLGHTVSNVLNLAHLKWQNGQHPHWSDVLPYYGQHPVT